MLELANREQVEPQTATVNVITAKPNKKKGKAKAKTKKADKPLDNYKCFNCRKKGHYIADCRLPKKDKPKPNSAKAGSSSLHVVEYSDSKSDAPLFAHFGAPENWLMDVPIQI